MNVLKPWMIHSGRIIALGLFLFDLLLGLFTAIWPEVYFSIVHPELPDPQIELLRRSGGMWLAFAVVALITATCQRDVRARWFMVLGWFRLIEVPADLLYGLTATGTGAYGQILILAAPPLNLLIGGYLFWLSRRMHQARLAEEADSTPDE